MLFKGHFALLVPLSSCFFYSDLQVFDLYGVGSRKTFSTPNLAKELNLKVTALSKSFLADELEWWLFFFQSFQTGNPLGPLGCTLITSQNLLPQLQGIMSLLMI